MEWTISDINNDKQYSNTNPSSAIKKINLAHSQNGDRVISVTVPLEYKVEFELALINSRFPMNRVKIGFTPERPHRIQSTNISLLANFMKIVKSLAENFEMIEQNISQTLGVDLHQEYTIPASERPLRQSLRLTIPAANANPSRSIGPALGQLGFLRQPQPALPQGITHGNSERASGQFLQLTISAANANPSRPIGLALGQRGWARPPQPVLPQNITPGNNEALLTAINFSGDIPLEYLCPVSLSIMTDPVYDPLDSTKARFERSYIMAALIVKQENPLNRAPLNPAALILDVQLKNEIDNFVQMTINNNPAPTQSM